MMSIDDNYDPPPSLEIRELEAEIATLRAERDRLQQERRNGVIVSTDYFDRLVEALGVSDDTMPDVALELRAKADLLAALRAACTALPRSDAHDVNHDEAQQEHPLMTMWIKAADLDAALQKEQP